MPSSMFSKELLDKYKEGKRSFSNIIIQFADLQGANLQNIHIKDSKLLFVAFRNCNLSGARFSNCEMFFDSFYGSDLTDAVFDNCKIDFGLFENAIFNKTKIAKSRISYSAMYNANIQELDMTTSDQFRVLTDPSQITEDVVENGLAIILPFMDKLDTNLRSIIKKKIEAASENQKFSYSLKGNPASYKKEGTYSSAKAPSYGNASGYGMQMGGLLHDVIEAYSSAQKKRSSYSQNNEYK